MAGLDGDDESHLSSVHRAGRGLRFLWRLPLVQNHHQKKELVNQAKDKVGKKHPFHHKGMTATLGLRGLPSKPLPGHPCQAPEICGGGGEGGFFGLSGSGPQVPSAGQRPQGSLPHASSSHAHCKRPALADRVSSTTAGVWGGEAEEGGFWGGEGPFGGPLVTPPAAFPSCPAACLPPRPQRAFCKILSRGYAGSQHHGHMQASFLKSPVSLLCPTSLHTGPLLASSQGRRGRSVIFKNPF